jgi:hypothetical protein
VTTPGTYVITLKDSQNVSNVLYSQAIEYKADSDGKITSAQFIADQIPSGNSIPTELSDSEVKAQLVNKHASISRDRRTVVSHKFDKIYVYIYDASQTTWVRSFSTDQYGIPPSSSAVNQDGSIILAGFETGDTPDGQSTGFVAVMHRNTDGSYSEHAKVFPTQYTTEFGKRCYISDGGDRIAVLSTDYAFVFELGQNPTDIVLQGVPFLIEDYAGVTENGIAFSRDGTMLAVGKPLDIEPGFQGLVDIFVLAYDAASPSTYSMFNVKNTPADVFEFGRSVTFSSDGNHIVVGFKVQSDPWPRLNTFDISTRSTIFHQVTDDIFSADTLEIFSQHF